MNRRPVAERRVGRPRPDRGDPDPAHDGSEILFGIHPVLEALEAGRRTIDRILVARDGVSGLGRILRQARERGVPVTHLPREVLARKAGRREVHQGVLAIVSAVPYEDPDAVCRRAAARPDGLLVALDGVEDPRNLGATVRSAAAAGADGLLLGLEGSVGLTPVAAKASAGAVEKLPVAREPRLRQRLLALRESGFRILGLDPRGGSDWDRLDLRGRNILVAGGEGRGLRKSLADACDHRVRIPLEHGVESLNVSVSVAVVLFELVRQRRLAGVAERTS